MADPQSDRSIGAPAVAPGRPGQYTRETGFLSYYEVTHSLNCIVFVTTSANSFDWNKMKDLAKQLIDSDR